MFTNYRINSCIIHSDNQFVIKQLEKSFTFRIFQATSDLSRLQQGIAMIAANTASVFGQPVSQGGKLGNHLSCNSSNGKLFASTSYNEALDKIYQPGMMTYE